MTLKRNRRMTKMETYANPHVLLHSMFFELDNAAIDTTIYPLMNYDEGRGAPSALETNPQNASFVVDTSPNCFINSRVDKITSSLKFSLTSKAIDDNIPAIQVSFMLIKMAFKEGYIAIDELTSEEVQDVLELQTESTDRQGFPLYNGTKIVEKFSGSATLHANVDGLTTTQVIEGVTFSESTFYNALHYKTTSGMLKSSTRGLKWLTLTPNRPVAKVTLHIDSKVKRMNEYTFYGLLINVPIASSQYQIPVTADITAATNYVSVDVNCRYNEWNLEFNPSMI